MNNLVKCFFILLFIPFTVNAKTVCLVRHEPAYLPAYPYLYVKLVVGPLGKGAISPLRGIWDVGGANVPVSGTALTISNGKNIRYFYTGMLNGSQKVEIYADWADLKYISGPAVMTDGGFSQPHTYGFMATSCKNLPNQ